MEINRNMGTKWVKNMPSRALMNRDMGTKWVKHLKILKLDATSLK